MDAKIDYLSFTLLVDVRDAVGQGAAADVVQSALATSAHSFYETFVCGMAWQVGSARGHYAFSYFQPDTFTSIRYGGSANHILVEMPGTACQAARDAHMLDQLIGETAARLTRLDVAVDVPGGCSPREFVAAGYNARFKSYAEIVSADGETEYVGSMKSERFSRVYRYAPPHPRAGVLRIETVLRSDYAKSAAGVLAGSSVVFLAAMLGNTFGWQAPDWQPGTLTNGKLHAQRSDRHEPARVRWLYQVCIPSLARAVNEGLIDRDALYERLAALTKGQSAG